MTRRTGSGRAWAIARLTVALLIAAAIAAQAAQTIGGAAEAGRDVATTVANFFSFFTVLSNVGAVIVLSWGAVHHLRHPRRTEEPYPLALALAAVTTYMLVTGVVYNLLLRGIELPQGTTVPWSNEVLHLIGPLFLLADLLLAPRRRRLPWHAIGALLVFPLLWVVYTMVRGGLITNPVTGAPFWYPYPFLDPNGPGGYPSVLVYAIGIALGIAAAATLVVFVGRRRAAR